MTLALCEVQLPRIQLASDVWSSHFSFQATTVIDLRTWSDVLTVDSQTFPFTLPAAYPAREFVEAGRLIAYAVNYPDLYLRLANFVDKIFKGANPGELPVEQPTKFELVINMKIAEALGVAIPQSLLLRADEVM